MRPSAASLAESLAPLLTPLYRRADTSVLPLTVIALSSSADGQSQLFSKHVGAVDSVVANAARHARLTLLDDMFSYVSGCEPVTRLADPLHNFIEGPRVDTAVWVAMFLGREAAARLRSGDGGYDDHFERDVDMALVHDVARLSRGEILLNVLRYLREEAAAKTPAELLRLAAMYGLDGAVPDILDGRYGDAVRALSIDEPLYIMDEDWWRGMLKKSTCLLSRAT